MSQVCIYPKEAAAVTGNGYQAGKRLLQRIRVQLGKPSRALVSIQEFCAYTHLPEQEVRAALARTQLERGATVPGAYRKRGDGCLVLSRPVIAE